MLRDPNDRRRVAPLPGAEEEDEEVAAVLARKRIGRCEPARRRISDDPQGRMANVTRAALAVRQAMQTEIDRLRRENEAMARGSPAAPTGAAAPAGVPEPPRVDAELLTTVADLEAEIRRLRRDNERMRGEPASTAEVAALRRANEDLERANEELRESQRRDKAATARQLDELTALRREYAARRAASDGSSADELAALDHADAELERAIALLRDRSSSYAASSSSLDGEAHRRVSHLRRRPPSLHLAPVLQRPTADDDDDDDEDEEDEESATSRRRHGGSAGYYGNDDGESGGAPSFANNADESRGRVPLGGKHPPEGEEWPALWGSPSKFVACAGIPEGVALLSLALEALPSRLRHGGFLVKVPFSSPMAKAAAPQRRWFRIALRRKKGPSGDLLELVLSWVSTAESALSAPSVLTHKDRAVVLEEVLELREGHATPAWWVHEAGALPAAPRCLSLVTKDRTLDVAAESDEDARHWRKGLRSIVAMLRHRRSKCFLDGNEAGPLLQRIPVAADGAPAAARTTRTRSGMRASEDFSSSFAAQHRGPLSSTSRTEVSSIASHDSSSRCQHHHHHRHHHHHHHHHQRRGSSRADDGAELMACLERRDLTAARAVLARAAGADAVVANFVHSKGTGVSSLCFETPLHVAARRGDAAATELLLEHHADARSRDSKGRTPAHVAIIGGRPFFDAEEAAARDVVAILLDAAGDDVLEARDDGGDVPLHTAARLGSAACATLLLETAADCSARNHAGQTPADVAARAGHLGLVEIIAEYAYDGPPPRTAAATTTTTTPSGALSLTPVKRKAPDDANDTTPVFRAAGAAWKERACHHQGGLLYFENVASGQTQWEDPRDQPETHEEEDDDGDEPASPALLTRLTAEPPAYGHLPLVLYQRPPRTPPGGHYSRTRTGPAEAKGASPTLQTPHTLDPRPPTTASTAAGPKTPDSLSSTTAPRQRRRALSSLTNVSAGGRPPPLAPLTKSHLNNTPDSSGPVRADPPPSSRGGGSRLATG